MTKIIPEEKARQGRWGWRVLIILIAALLLTFAVWGGVEFYGEAIDQNSPAQQGEAPTG